MRIKVTMNSPAETWIELNYNYYISSMIYDLLRKSSSKYSQKLHEEGYVLGTRKFKLFTFSNLFPQKYKVEGNFLIVQGKVNLYISSPKQEFVLHLAEGLLSSGSVSIGQSRFNIETVEVLPEPEFTNEMRFKCLSPIAMNTVEETESGLRTIPCVPGTDKFEENIRNNLIKKYCLLYGKLPEDQSLKIEFDENDLQRYGRGKLIRYKEMFIKAYAIPFVMKGSVELMKVGYDCGMGEKNSAGCGMVERGGILLNKRVPD